MVKVQLGGRSKGGIFETVSAERRWRGWVGSMVGA